MSLLTKTFKALGNILYWLTMAGIACIVLYLLLIFISALGFTIGVYGDMHGWW